MSCYSWYGLFAFDKLSSETVQLCSAAFKNSSAMVQNSSTGLKADIVTVKEVIAQSKDLIADLITDNVTV